MGLLGGNILFNSTHIFKRLVSTTPRLKMESFATIVSGSKLLLSIVDICGDPGHAFNPLSTNVLLHIETSQLICTANQLTGFYMMGNIGL